ncbi:uncharacterized protein N7518_007675 [Penicillium psychrosexuale]|uniref:uncharacterized protein n=1 Tax=Penicillium psychrosexuale TaxID=1002107 RepID=UPI0025459104|nr:uncharacterized protein N7518_007675 [Penicillium psychrosexuale]KAJ5790664.1 hypothetical protein N7518_007675 [Penicillium psychrosexuale]
MDRGVFDWFAALQFWKRSLSGEEYALDGVGCRPVQDSTHQPATHPAVFLPPRGTSQPLTIILRVAQPTPSRAGVARRNSQDKTCSPAETLPVKNCPSGQTPQANNKCIMLFGADIPCKVTKTSERHERPFTC